jgi:hypothetical protein
MALQSMLGNAESTVMLDNPWEGWVIAVVNTVIINAPQGAAVYRVGAFEHPKPEPGDFSCRRTGNALRLPSDRDLGTQIK